MEIAVSPCDPKTFEVRLSRWNLVIAVIICTVFAGSAAFMVLVETDWKKAAWAAAAIACGAFALVLLRRAIRDFPVIEISSATIVFRHPWVASWDSIVPLDKIAEAKSFWNDSTSDEVAPELVLIMDEPVTFTKGVICELTERTRDRWKLPRDRQLLFYPCSTCTPRPKVLCEEINKAIARCNEAPTEPVSNPFPASP